MSNPQAPISALAARQERIRGVPFDYDAQSVEGVVACNLCGYDRFVTMVHRDRYGFSAEAQGCLRCGLVFLNPVMTRSAYGAFYESVYRPLVSAYHGRRIDAETIQDEQRVYAGAKARLLSRYLPGGRRGALLDIGGSTGVVAHHLARRFGLDGFVLDPAPTELREAERLGLTAIRGFVEDFDPGERRFELVTICQTLDHLLDVGSALRMVRRILAPEGVLFADVVDFRAAYLRSWSVEEAVKVDHPFYLTEETASAYLRRAGFDILQVDYAADHLHVGYVCRPATPEANGLPPAAAVEAQWREVRMVQNAPARR